MPCQIKEAGFKPTYRNLGCLLYYYFMVIECSIWINNYDATLLFLSFSKATSALPSMFRPDIWAIKQLMCWFLNKPFPHIEMTFVEFTVHDCNKNVRKSFQCCNEYVFPS